MCDSGVEMGWAHRINLRLKYFYFSGSQRIGGIVRDREIERERRKKEMKEKITALLNGREWLLP